MLEGGYVDKNDIGGSFIPLLVPVAEAGDFCSPEELFFDIEYDLCESEP